MYPPKNEHDTLDPSRQGSEEGPSRMSQTKDELIASESDVMYVPDGGAKAWLTVMGA
jgi:hypothetical protein